jgi:hypothetical protein
MQTHQDEWKWGRQVGKRRVIPANAILRDEGVTAVGPAMKEQRDQPTQAGPPSAAISPYATRSESPLLPDDLDLAGK